MKVIKISTHSDHKEKAALWFSQQWHIPYEAYLESMTGAIDQLNHVPEWYIAVDENQNIVAGAGVIDNDFHQRTDLTPNLCALFVEPQYRRQHLAKQLLDFARRDYANKGFKKLYLITDLNDFYEKCGWIFLTMVITNDGEPMKMYETQTIS
ncbi:MULTISPECIES: GNAT family N-acetyltransferase [unclassified Acinetobacter]|uniref:GNAT family N-acetyltransferase n=1 Tax=unclassified Acinetobacter TaxID=196816 RepID=UPI001909887B|nr:MULTISPECIES: GNAT family N-acetyltransferase [unclassified Acinetobacter]MBK0064962.1 GNAT family N-acetyltransferase [Acinetobacter sp. S55]MBK0067347.1 GNAT family N-acetyltransferase [Acinetobacter sp. S54]